MIRRTPETAPVWAIVLPQIHGRGLDQWETTWRGLRWTLMTWNPDDCPNEESRLEIDQYALDLSTEGAQPRFGNRPWITVFKGEYGKYGDDLAAPSGDSLLADRDAILADLPAFVLKVKGRRWVRRLG